MSAPDKSAKYVAASIDDIPTIPYEWAPETEWKPMRRYFSIGSFGTNLFRAPKAGDVLTEDHTEDPDSGTRHEELYLVVTGSAALQGGRRGVRRARRDVRVRPRPDEHARRRGQRARHGAARRGRRARLCVRAVGVGPGPTAWSDGVSTGLSGRP